MHLHDDLSVGNHHSNAAEERLQVLRQLLAPGIAGVHRDEEAHAGVQRHSRAVREGELLAALPYGTQHTVDLPENMRNAESIPICRIFGVKACVPTLLKIMQT